jgi:hypothetical protein
MAHYGLSPFQQTLLDGMVAGTWYATHHEETRYPLLPAWFFRRQAQPWATLRSMISKGVLAVKYIGGDLRPIVCKKYGLDKPRRVQQEGGALGGAPESGD